MDETTSERICSLLKQNPKGLTIEEVSRKLALNRTTAAKYLNALVNSGEADLRELGRAKLFTMSRRVPLNYVINLLSDLILVLDQDHTIVEANTALLDWFDLLPDTILKHRIEQTPLNSYLSEEFHRSLHYSLQGKGCTYEIAVDRKGSIGYFRARFIPLVYSNGQPGISIIFEDITETKIQQHYLEERVQKRTEELARANDRLTQKIKEHRQTLSALRESEMKYRRIVETSLEGIWIGDSSFTIQSCNQRFYEILGYVRPDEVIGKNFSSFIFPEDLPRHFQKIANRARGIKETYERRLCRRDGSACWTLITATPVLNPDGSLNSVFEMVTDISAQKEMELELEKKNRHYEQLLQTSTDAIHVIDKDKNLIEWNPTFLEHLGYTAAEAASLNEKDWDIGSPHENVCAEILSGECGKSIRFETCHRTKQGIKKEVEICATRIIINGEEMFYASARDITERKKIEHAIQARTNWLREIATTVGGLLWEMDETGLYLNCSPTVEKILGYTPEEIIGRLHYYELFPENERERLRSEVEKIFKARRPFRSFRNLAVSKDGHIILFESTGVPTFGPRGIFTGYRGIALVRSDTAYKRKGKNVKSKRAHSKTRTPPKKEGP